MKTKFFATIVMLLAVLVILPTSSALAAEPIVLGCPLRWCQCGRRKKAV